MSISTLPPSPANAARPANVWTGAARPAAIAESRQLAGLAEHRLTYDGDLRMLYSLFFRNLLLIAATGGIYYFWGKVRLRQYLWSRLSLDGYRFEFLGRGGEMLAGFLMVLLGLMAWGLATMVIEFTAAADHFLVSGGLAVITFLLLFFLAFVAQFSAQRYRLTRTRWRGIGAGMKGSALVYAFKAFVLMALLPLTLYQIRPFVSLRLLRHRLNRTWIGDRPLHADELRAGDLYGSYFVSCLGVIGMSIVVGIVVALFALFVYEQAGYLIALVGLNIGSSIFVYAVYYLTAAWVMAGFWARYWAYVGDRLRWGHARFRIAAPRAVFVSHRVWHLLAITLTAGLAYPWALHRAMGFFADHVSVHGDLDLAHLRQTELRGAAIGEGLINAFDPGFI